MEKPLNNKLTYYLGLAIIIIQFLGYGFLFVQDRNEVVGRVDKTEEAIKEIKEHLKTLDKVRTMEHNLKRFMEQQGYKYLD